MRRALAFAVLEDRGRRIPNIQQGILNNEVYIPAGEGMTQQQIAAEAIAQKMHLCRTDYFLASPGTRSGCLV